MSGRARPTRPRRADLSQHFLRAARAAGLIQATSIDNTDLVIEIGAGRGALTKPLVRRAGRVRAVELDPYLADGLRASFAIEVHTGDFLEQPLPQQAYKVVGNIPYAITTAIVRKLVDAPGPPLDAWLIVQRETAQRLCGRPYTRESHWSLRLKPSWHVEILDRVKRTDFDPPPSVDSAFLWLSHRARPLLSPTDWDVYRQLIRSVYHGHATLPKAVRPFVSKVQLRRLAADLHFDPTADPASLQFEHWLGITRFVRCHGRGTR